MRFEVAHVYFAQHCFLLPLPHMPFGIENASATSQKTKDPGLHKGNRGAQTLYVYSQKGLTACMDLGHCCTFVTYGELPCVFILPCLFLVRGEVGKTVVFPFSFFKNCETGSLMPSLFDWRLSWFLFSFTDKPQPPRGPFEASEIDGESMTLTWQPPKDDGGEPVANYIVEKRKAGTNRWTKVSSFCHSPKCQVGHCCVGLLSASGYSSFIVAYNASSHLSRLVFALCLALI